MILNPVWYKKQGGTPPAGEQYTLRISKSRWKSYPNSCMSYTEGVSTKEEAYAVMQSLVEPTVVRNGTVAYKLDPTNLAYKEDGVTPSNLDGTDGDVCMSIKPFWWKIVTNDASYLDIRISTGPIEGYQTAHKFNGTIRKYLHLGMFLSTTQACTSVYSTTATPLVSTANDTFRASTEARGATYGLQTYLSRAAYQIMCVFAASGLHTQVSIGYDRTNRSPVPEVSTEAMLTCGGFTSSTRTTNYTSLMYLFLANPWGSVMQHLSGVKGYTGVGVGIATDQADARGVSLSAQIPASWSTFAFPANAQTYNWTYLPMMLDYAPFFPETTSTAASATKGFADKSIINPGTYGAIVGGHCTQYTSAGLFATIMEDYGSTISGDMIGARLQILDTENAW